MDETTEDAHLGRPQIGHLGQLLGDPRRILREDGRLLAKGHQVFELCTAMPAPLEKTQ